MKSLTTLFFTILTILSFAQTQMSSADRFIEVTGDGEVKLDPNIIYLSIDLREYRKDGKIVKLEELEAQLTRVLQTVGIPTENLKVYATSGRQYDLRKRKSNLLIGKRYSLKLTEVDLLNPLLAELGEVDIFSVSVTEVTHSEIEKHKTDAKIQAVSDAKAKAALLATNLEAKLGQVVQIRETELVDSYPLQALQGRAAGVSMRGVNSYTAYGYDKGTPNTVDFEQIKLTYKIVVKFRLE